MEFYSGLDWSGNPGEPNRSPGSNPRLVVAVVTIHRRDLARLQATLGAVRTTLRLPENHAFKHLEAADRTLRLFFEALREVDVAIAALIIDKRSWSADYVKQTTGPQRISNAIVELVCRGADRSVAGQRLFIDLPRAELAFLRQFRPALRRSLQAMDRRSYRSIDPRSDHGGDGDLIQIADMVVGELYDRGALGGPCLDLIRSRLFVHE